MTRPLLATVLAAAALAGCSQSEPELVPPNVTESIDPTVSPVPIEPSPTVNATESADLNAVDELPPAEEPAPDEQMLDDASTTGMTARVARGEEGTADEQPAANEVE